MFARPNSNLIWHNVFVTAPLFRHIDFNAWFRSFGGTLFFLSDSLTWCEPGSFIWDHPPFVIGFDSHQHHRYKVIHRGRTWSTTTRAHLPTHPLTHSSQNVSSASTYFIWCPFISNSLYVFQHNIQIHTYQLIHSTFYVHIIYLMSIHKYSIVCFSAEHTNSYLLIDVWHIL
jgi:hypothetical protein